MRVCLVARRDVKSCLVIVPLLQRRHLAGLSARDQDIESASPVLKRHKVVVAVVAWRNLPGTLSVSMSATPNGSQLVIAELTRTPPGEQARPRHPTPWARYYRR